MSPAATAVACGASSRSRSWRYADSKQSALLLAICGAFLTVACGHQPELGQRSDSFEKKRLEQAESSDMGGGGDPAVSTILPFGLEDDDAGPGSLSPARDGAASSGPVTITPRETVGVAGMKTGGGAPAFSPAGDPRTSEFNLDDMHEGSAGPDEAEEVSVQTPRESAMEPLIKEAGAPGATQAGRHRREPSGGTSPEPQECQAEYNPQPQDNTNVVSSMGTNGDRVVRISLSFE